LTARQNYQSPQVNAYHLLMSGFSFRLHCLADCTQFAYLATLAANSVNT